MLTALGSRRNRANTSFLIVLASNTVFSSEKYTQMNCIGEDYAHGLSAIVKFYPKSTRVEVLKLGYGIDKKAPIIKSPVHIEGNFEFIAISNRVEAPVSLYS